jgi:hypothetical protein
VSITSVFCGSSGRQSGWGAAARAAQRRQDDHKSAQAHPFHSGNNLFRSGVFVRQTGRAI